MANLNKREKCRGEGENSWDKSNILLWKKCDQLWSALSSHIPWSSRGSCELMSPAAWLCLALFGPAWLCLAIWLCQALPGFVWPSLALSGSAILCSLPELFPDHTQLPVTVFCMFWHKGHIPFAFLTIFQLPPWILLPSCRPQSMLFLRADLQRELLWTFSNYVYWWELVAGNSVPMEKDKNTRNLLSQTEPYFWDLLLNNRLITS